MGLTHICIITNPMQDHRKLNSQLIYDEVLSVISGNPSLKVSTISRTSLHNTIILPRTGRNGYLGLRRLKQCSKIGRSHTKNFQNTRWHLSIMPRDCCHFVNLAGIYPRRDLC